MNKNVFDALEKLNERLETEVVPQIKAVGELVGQTTIEVAEEADLGLDDLDDFKAGAELIFASIFKNLKGSQE